MAMTWRCPRCGRRFANRNQSHSCVNVSLDDFLKGKTPAVVALFRRVVELAQGLGPVTVIPHETKLSLQARTNFAGVTFRREYLLVELLLPQPTTHPRLQPLPPHSPTSHAHLVRLTAAKELDREFEGWLAQAYAIGSREPTAAKAPPTG